ncbi:MAG: methyl-accepting chemotaxis protein [Spirochaetota bacterium]
MKNLTSKIVLMTVGVALLIGLVTGFFMSSLLLQQSREGLQLYEKSLRDGFDRLIKYEVQTVHSMLATIKEMEENGRFGPEEAKTLAADITRELRYGDDGYFWVDTSEGKNVVLLGQDVEGTNRMDLQDVKGNFLIQEIVKQGLKRGGGFTDYWFPKAGGDEALPKRGFSLHFEPYDWIVGTGNYTDDIDAIIEEQETSFIQQARAATTRMLIVIGVVLIAGILFAYFFSRRIVKPVKQADRLLEEIAEGGGDLTRELHVSGRDEIADLTSNFNRFVTTLRSIVNSVKDEVGRAHEQRDAIVAGSTETASSVEEISATSSSIYSQVERLNQQVSDTSDSMETITSVVKMLESHISNQASAVEESAASINEMVASIQNVATTTSDKRTRIEELLKFTKSGREEISRTEKKVDDLNARVSEVMNIVSMINDIADQTNLLAMNASIEAAHAGESGRGFAVVAGEIRKLAESSSNNASQISNTLESTVDSISELKTFTEHTVQTYQNIEERAHEATEAFTEVSATMEELSTGATEINNAVESLREITAEVKNGSADMTSGAESIRTSTTNVEEVSQNVYHAVSEINTGIQEINAAVSDLNEAIQFISGTIDAISKQVEQFRT